MQRLAISGTASSSPSTDTGTPESSSAPAAGTKSAPSTATSSTKSSLASRNRENQRLSRARRKDYISSLEGRIRDYERQGAQATIEMQRAAREVMDANANLKDLLANNVCAVCRNSIDETNSTKRRKGSRGQGAIRVPGQMLTTGLTKTSTTHITPVSSNGSSDTSMRVSTNIQSLKSPTDISQAPSTLDDIPTSANIIFNQFSHFIPPYTTTPFTAQVQQHKQPPQQQRDIADSSASTPIESDCCSGQTVCVPSSPVLVRSIAASKINTPTSAPHTPTSKSCKPSSSCCPPKKSTATTTNPSSKSVPQDLLPRLESQSQSPQPFSPSSSQSQPQRPTSSSSCSDNSHNLSNNNDNYGNTTPSSQKTLQRITLPDTTECNVAVKLFQDMTDHYDSHEIKQMLCPTDDGGISCQVDNGTLFKLLDQFSV